MKLDIKYQNDNIAGAGARKKTDFAQDKMIK